MTDYDDGFDDRPRTHDDAPDECQWNGCTKIPRRAVKFVSPPEYLCYCGEHVSEVFGRSTAKSTYMIR